MDSPSEHRHRHLRGAWIGLLWILLLAGCPAPRQMAISGPPSWGKSDEVPTFPWPPPESSAMAVLPQYLFQDHQKFQTLGDFDQALQAGLRSTGYMETSYLAVPAGFALVTRIEHIEPDGTPKAPEQRWTTEPQKIKITRFSLRAYLRALFTENPGFYRVNVFVVTDVPFSRSDAQVTPDDAHDWLVGGLDVLPATIASRPWTREIKCTVLIYEFVRREGKEPEILRRASPDGPGHLKKAKLWAALGLPP
jgi:hypothetical protein